ncbi:MFS transporter [Actinacidiphila paucisporea]|uniref:Predicted arabinose efflux permease, MFS family n=1 Tax=Actinacidiphila paucisporea TaxID=310782 RepID=A0A1M6X5G7_9ACTN|nr:MFS transporter [Actinacidiphila paucisporea]SHL01089.1 Predicted arabinose efflux permease, MFS family [Actinacidiphila paucisporea]
MSTATALRGLADRTPALLRERQFRSYWTGQTVSLFGDEISYLAVPLAAVFVLHVGPTAMGWLRFAGLLPALLFSLPAGAWADRRGRRRQTMIVADLARAGLMASLPLGYALGVLTFAQMCVVVFAVGTLAVVFDVCNAALFVSLVPPTQYVEGNSLTSGSRAFSFVAGPSAGGLLVQVLAAPLALLADAGSYLASAWQLARIAPVEPPAAERGKGQLTAGLRFLARSPLLWPMLACVATISFFTFAFSTLVVLYAVGELGLSAGTLGAVIGAGAFGSLLGAVVSGRIIRAIGVGPAITLGALAFPAPLVLVPLAGGPTPLVLSAFFFAEFASGLGVMLLDIAAGSLQAAVIPGVLRSRVTGAFRTVNYGVRPLGALTGGFLGSTIGLRPALWTITLGGTLGVLWLLPSRLLRTRDLPTQQ